MHHRVRRFSFFRVGASRHAPFPLLQILYLQWEPPGSAANEKPKCGAHSPCFVPKGELSLLSEVLRFVGSTTSGCLRIYL